MLLASLFEYALCIPFSMQNGDNLKRASVWPVRYGLIGITGQRPEAEYARREISA